MSNMPDTIYSAVFAKQLCDEYNQVRSQINRASKEAVSNGQYYCHVLIPNHYIVDEDIVKAISEFEEYGYRVVGIFNYNSSVNDSVKMLIRWD